ncbi:MAG: undecaprenyldiphospho-muramoylpentapeptide beta-N-acetylglucosaminyltransferase [Oscillospiraceae bacterium]|nr:undecaprenyldiphospho-muramoylpentapeptide beta-N-acetylglucosaminyltransferase [Oscillospiraceae bacterium]
MRVILSGGGTAGHINPAIAIAQKIQKEIPDAEILFVGTPSGMESDLVQKAGFAFTGIEVQGIRRKLSFQNIVRNIKAVSCAVAAGPRSRKLLADFRPDLVIGTGGYVSGPVVRKAAQMGIPTAIHEQNAFPGVTNKLLAKQVDIVFLAVEKAKEHLPSGKKYVVVGNPIRESIVMKGKAEARAELGMDDRLCIVSFGGSLGAVKLSEIVADIMEWHGKRGDVNHIHAMGRLGKENFPKLLAERGIDPQKNPRLDIRDYIDNMDVCLAAADLVVCRAGAITLSELEATGKPSILIPSPNVTENHQYHNEMVLADHGAAVVIEEKNYNKEALFEVLDDFYQHPEKLKEYSRHAYELAILDTADRIYQEICALLEQKSK